MQSVIFVDKLALPSHFICKQWVIKSFDNITMCYFCGYVPSDIQGVWLSQLYFT